MRGQQDASLAPLEPENTITILDQLLPVYAHPSRKADRRQQPSEKTGRNTKTCLTQGWAPSQSFSTRIQTDRQHDHRQTLARQMRRARRKGSPCNRQTPCNLVHSLPQPPAQSSPVVSALESTKLIDARPQHSLALVSVIASFPPVTLPILSCAVHVCLRQCCPFSNRAGSGDDVTAQSSVLPEQKLVL